MSLSYYDITFFVLVSLMFACTSPTTRNESDWLSEYLGLSDEELEEARELGLYIERDSACDTKIFSENSLPKFNTQDTIQFSLDSFENEVEKLYMLIGDNVGKPVQSDFEISNNVNELLLALEKGEYIPQCAGVSQFSQLYLSSKFPGVHIDIIEVSTVEHTLNVILYAEDNNLYAFAFDVQNGFFYPSRHDEILNPIPLQELGFSQMNNYDIHWLDDEILNSKRNFVDTILPCGFLPQLGRNYHKSSEDSKYKYELLGPSFHKILWFDLEQANIMMLKQELIAILLAVTP